MLSIAKHRAEYVTTLVGTLRVWVQRYVRDGRHVSSIRWKILYEQNEDAVLVLNLSIQKFFAEFPCQLHVCQFNSCLGGARRSKLLAHARRVRLMAHTCYCVKKSMVTLSYARPLTDLEIVAALPDPAAASALEEIAVAVSCRALERCSKCENHTYCRTCGHSCRNKGRPCIWSCFWQRPRGRE